ncbi:hypothetical protein D3C75_568530 [compost metagenome]
MDAVNALPCGHDGGAASTPVEPLMVSEETLMLELPFVISRTNCPSLEMVQITPSACKAALSWSDCCAFACSAAMSLASAPETEILAPIKAAACSTANWSASAVPASASVFTNVTFEKVTARSVAALKFVANNCILASVKKSGV